MPGDGVSRTGRRRALARALSRVARASVAELIAHQVDFATDPPWTIAITGPAGVGKSTLIARLAPARLARLTAQPADGKPEPEQELLAILAVDPSSPVSGGALLGDRIRMDAIGDDPRILVRSLASGGAYGGLSRNLSDLLGLVEAHGFREILIETAGVGQSEYAARGIVDTVVLVLQPDTGDYVQAMKSGLMDVADIYVVNKADMPGASRTIGEIESILRHLPNPDGPNHNDPDHNDPDHSGPVHDGPNSNGAKGPHVLAVSAGEGIGDLDAAIEAHRSSLSGEQIAVRRRRRERFWLQSMVMRRVEEIMASDDAAHTAGTRKERYRRLLAAIADDLRKDG